MHLNDLAESIAGRIKHMEDELLKYSKVDGCDHIDRKKLKIVILNYLEEAYGANKD